MSRPNSEAGANWVTEVSGPGPFGAAVSVMVTVPSSSTLPWICGPPGNAVKAAVRIDGKGLRIGVKDGKVSVPALSPEEPVEPDLVVEIAPGVLSQLLNGAVDVDAAIESGRVQLDGDRAEARRLFEMFRFPSAEDARV